MHYRTLSLAIVLLYAFPALAAPGGNGVYEKRTYTTAFARPAPPVIDGDLGDPCWDAVAWGADFVQWEPTEGAPPTYQTAFKILYDDKALYVAYRAYDDDPREIDDLLARRDWFPGDWVEINIDSRHDHRTAFSFTASVSGTRGDEFISNDGNNWDGNWDPIWELKTRIDDRGWTAEAKIPLSQLRYADAEEHVWGIQVQRRLFRREERSVWQPKSKDESGWVSRFGELLGIKGIRPQRQVEILPYAVADLTRSESVSGDPFHDGSETDAAVGVDGKVGVTGDLTLDFTVNPDFGQVEADPSEVNLSAFETFFEEKRPFFIEGSNILSFQIAPSIAGGSFTSDNLFYSRRIGLRPHHAPDLGDGEYADVPENTSILGAVKLTGKTRNGLSLGIMDNMTAEEQATIDALGAERKETVEPFTNFFVGRALQDFDRGNTRLGGMVTAVNRRIDDAPLRGLHRSAYSGGIDFFHYWNNKSWYVAANGAMSRVAGEAEALLQTQTSSARYFQRPDNTYRSVDSTRTSLGGHAGSLRLARGSGKGNFRFETGAAWRSPGFETNDVGFLRRADEVNQFTWVGYSVRNPVGIFRRLSINGNQWLDWDFGGTNLVRQANTNMNATFRNNWNCGAGVTRTLEFISNTELRGGPSSKWPGDVSAHAWVGSDQNRPVSSEVGAAIDHADENSRRYWEWWVDLRLRPSNAVQVSLSPWYGRNNREMQYVATRSRGGEDRYLFGRLHQKTAAITVRVDYTVTPNLTVQFYGSPFISSGRYTEFKRITDPRAGEYRDRFHVFTDAEIAYDPAADAFDVDEDADGGADYSIGNPDFNFREFNSNLVVRWEFQPGSLLYLVWSQARDDVVAEGRFSLGDGLDGLFGVHPRNIFLVKMSKWFSL
jgi:hypothetical protein